MHMHMNKRQSSYNLKVKPLLHCAIVDKCIRFSLRPDACHTVWLKNLSAA